jgi:hypothetical protein
MNGWLREFDGDVLVESHLDRVPVAVGKGLNSHSITAPVLDFKFSKVK